MGVWQKEIADQAVNVLDHVASDEVPDRLLRVVGQMEDQGEASGVACELAHKALEAFGESLSTCSSLKRCACSAAMASIAPSVSLSCCGGNEISSHTSAL